MRQHPDIESVVHTSVPQFFMPDTEYPNLRDCDAVIWVVRYEPIRLESIKRYGYEAGRTPLFRPPFLYSAAITLILTSRQVVFISYESLISPLGRMVLDDAFRRLGLNPERLNEAAFVPEDANAKYLR